MISSSFFNCLPSDPELRELYTLDLDEQAFTEYLAAALAKTEGSELSIKGFHRVFQYGVLMIDAIDFELSDLSGAKVDYKGLVPEEDLTQQNLNESSNDSSRNDGEDITSFEAHPQKLATAPLNGERRNSDMNIDKSPGVTQIHYLPKKIDETMMDISEMQNPSKVSEEFKKINIPHPNHSGDKYQLIGKVCVILRLWFGSIHDASIKLYADMNPGIVDLLGVANTLTQHELFQLLQACKKIIEIAATESSNNYIEALKEVILLIHEALSTIFEIMALESCNQSSNKFLIMKSLLHAFFQVDLSAPLNELLEITSPLRTTETLHDRISHEKFDLRLSYDTLMRLYTIYFSLANCPVSLLLVDKMSLSLDITTLEEISANNYSNVIVSRDFDSIDVQHHVTSRVLPLLTANYNYYYQLHPDILSNQYTYSNLLDWFVGKRAIPSLYMSIDRIGSQSVYPEHSMSADKGNPFLCETERYEYAKKIRKVRESKDTEYAVKSPTYLVIQLMMYQLVQNPSFVTYLTQQREGEAPFLDLWLCVSSYVHHYQYKSRINVFGSRVSLLVLLNLTSNENKLLPALRDYTINENTWRLCRHRPSAIPHSRNPEKKSALLYILDIIQIDLRFNLNKKLDFENCKTSLCVMYQILLFAEKNSFEDLRTYCWSELFKTILNFILFVHKHHNEEDTKYVVEEVFSTFEIILGPSLGGIVELSSDNWVFGKHVVKTLNYDMYYTILENYASLLQIFDRFIIKRDNFTRLADCFYELGKTFDLTLTRDRDLSEVENLLLGLLSATRRNPKSAAVNFANFNYAETFKLLNKKRGFTEIQKLTEIIELFGLLFSNDWSR